MRCGVKLLNLHSRSYLPTFRAASPTHSRLRQKHALVLTRSPLCVTQVFLGVWEKDLPCFQKAISDPTSLSSSSTGLAAFRLALRSREGTECMRQAHVQACSALPAL